MKKLLTLKINTENIIRNDELITLRGGYSGCTCDCYNWEGDLVTSIESTALNCNAQCLAEIEHGYGHGNC